MEAWIDSPHSPWWDWMTSAPQAAQRGGSSGTWRHQWTAAAGSRGTSSGALCGTLAGGRASTRTWCSRPSVATSRRLLRVLGLSIGPSLGPYTDNGWGRFAGPHNSEGPFWSLWPTSWAGPRLGTLLSQTLWPGLLGNDTYVRIKACWDSGII